MPVPAAVTNQQQTLLRRKFQRLFDTQTQVNVVIKTCRNYEHMITPYNDIYLLNRTLRKYTRVYIDPNLTMTCPGVNQTFTLTKLDKLCADSEKLLQQFLCEKKPDNALNALMNITEELYQEQRWIINKYKRNIIGKIFSQELT